MPRNVVFRLNREIKMPQNSKIVPKNREIKMPQKFFALKFLTWIKVNLMLKILTFQGAMDWLTKKNLA